MNGFHYDHDGLQRFIRRENVIHFGRLLAIKTTEAERQVVEKLLAQEREKQREAGDLTPRSEFHHGTASRDQPDDGAGQSMLFEKASPSASVSCGTRARAGDEGNLVSS